MTQSDQRTGKVITGREAAYRAVLAVLRGDGFAVETLRTLRSKAELSNADAGLATELALGTIRHLLTIEHVLRQVARYDPTATPARLRAILALTAYQLIWMDRIPEHAAVDEAVKLARRHVHARASGMTNAVLRNLARAIESRRTDWRPNDPRNIRVDWTSGCSFVKNVLPDPSNTTEHLAAATGERTARFATLTERFGADMAAQIAWASQAVPTIALHPNTLRIETDTFCQRVADEFSQTAEYADGVAHLPASARVVHAPLVAEGRAYVQDPTAHSVSLVLAPQAGERILDLCAAPGGKTIALAIASRNAATIVASDADADRLKIVRQNANRLALSGVQVIPPSEIAGEFNAALLDVPCSNTGVIARRPEARLGLTARKLAALLDVQRDLLAQTAQRIRPGGRIVYSTCSLEPEENGDIVRAFLASHSNWSLTDEQIHQPHWGPNLADWRDGGYAALLHRK